MHIHRFRLKALSGKAPFYQYSQDAEIRSALSRGELPVRPTSTDDGTDEIDDLSWDLITRCCAQEPDDRFTLHDIQKRISYIGIQDNRSPARPLRGSEVLQLRTTEQGVDIARAGEVLTRVAVGHCFLSVQRYPKQSPLRLSFHHILTREQETERIRINVRWDALMLWSSARIFCSV